MKKQTARLNQIVQYLQGEPLLSVARLAEQCDVSDVTLRRDLKQLSDEGIVHVVNGAVSLNLSTDKLRIGDKYFISQQAQKQIEEKTQIGKEAAKLLEPNDTVVIDVGSTAYFFARAIPHDLPLTVICYSLNTFIELHDRDACNVIFAGGVFHRNSLMCEGAEGISLVKRLRARKAFMGATGVHESMGVTSSNYNEQAMKQAAISSSLTKYLLVDSMKFGVVKTAYFADLDDFDYVITDAGISPRYETHINNSGVTLVISKNDS